MNTTQDSDTERGEASTSSDADEPPRSHEIARAVRTRAVHLLGPDEDSCGLCLSEWPCPPRSWADLALGF